MLAGVGLLFAWGRLSAASPTFFTSWKFWFIASTLGYFFPALILLQAGFPFANFAIRATLIGQAFLTAVLTFLAQMYHYSAFYYGAPSSMVGNLDPIGIGVPSRVQIACDAENAALLKSLGVAMDDANVTAELFLVDETDQHYILAFEAVPSRVVNAGTLKIDKSVVKAMLFIPLSQH